MSKVMIWLTKEVHATIEESANALYPLETGGVLLGWRDGEQRIVAALVGPGPQALYGRHAFVPDHAWQLKKLQLAFHESSGDLDYLGDWHTHPDGAAEMSEADVRTLRRIAGRVHKPVMLIAAGDPHVGWALGAWMQQPRKLLKYPLPTEMKARRFDPPASWRFQVTAEALSA